MAKVGQAYSAPAGYGSTLGQNPDKPKKIINGRHKKKEVANALYNVECECEYTFLEEYVESTYSSKKYTK